MNALASQELVWATGVLLVLYALVILFFVVRGALKIKSMTDYAVGNIAFSPIAVGLSLAASMTSAATFIINPGFVALYGLSGFISMGIVLPLAALLSLYFLTKGFRAHGQTVKALTMAQWMGAMYKSKPFALFFGFLSLLLITFIVLIMVGLTKVIASALNFPDVPIMIGLVVFIFGYMMFGGANSMVYTNAIQAGLMIIVAIALLGSGFNFFEGGWSGFMDKLRAIDPVLAEPINPESFLFRDYFEIIFCQIVVGIAIVCQPHIITKSLLLKHDGDVKKYLWAGLTTEMLFFLVVFAGLYARLTFPDMRINGEEINVDSMMSAYVVSEFPVFVSIILILGLISAGLSTLEGLIQSLSTTITTDILKPILGQARIEGQGHKREIYINRGVIVLLALATIYFTYQQLVYPNLSVGIFAQNGVYAYFSAAFIPVLAGTFFKNLPLKIPVAAAFTAVVVHFSVYYGGLTSYMDTPVRNPGIAAALAICVSTSVAGILYLIHCKQTANKTS